MGVKPFTRPRLRLEPPRFDGENAPDWIRKIQEYYNHHYTPLDDRLYLTRYLFDHPASDWREYWEETNEGKSWDDFLLAVEQRFDPEFYKPCTVTASPRQFMGTGRTVQEQQKPNRTTTCPVADREPDQRKPIHTTACPVAVREPDQQPHQRKEEVIQVSDVNQFGALPLNEDSINIFANVSGSKSTVCDGSMIMNMGSTNCSVSNDNDFETIIGDGNFGTNSMDGDEVGDTVINITVDCGQPMMEGNEVDSVLHMDSSNSYSEVEILGVKPELHLQNREVNDDKLHVQAGHIQGVSDEASYPRYLYGDARTIPPHYTFPSRDVQHPFGFEIDEVQAIHASHLSCPTFEIADDPPPVPSVFTERVEVAESSNNLTNRSASIGSIIRIVESDNGFHMKCVKKCDDENNDGSLSVGSVQNIQDPNYAVTPTPLLSDEMKPCLEHHTLISIGSCDWFTMVQTLASDGRSIPPSTDVTRLGRTGWRLAGSPTANTFLFDPEFSSYINYTDGVFAELGCACACIVESTTMLEVEKTLSNIEELR